MTTVVGTVTSKGGFTGRIRDFLTYGNEARASGREATPVPVRMVGFPSDGGLIASGVTGTTALGLSAVWRCLDILSNGVSQLEWRERRGTLDLPPSRLVTRPQAQRTRREWTSLVVSTLALYDTCILLKAGGYDGEGVPLGLWPIDPRLVMPVQTDAWSLLPPTEYWIGSTRVSADDLVVLRRSPQPGIDQSLGGVIQLARATFAAAISAEHYASRYWQSGGAPTTVLETDANLSGPQSLELGDRWAESRSRGPDHPAVLTNGLKARAFGADPTQQSAVEARRELVADIARYFGCATTLVNAPAGDSETYSSTEAQGIHLVLFTLQNYLGAIEDAISDQLPTPRRLFIDPAKLFRGTLLSQAQSLQLATGTPWMEVDEAREFWGLPPIEVPSKLARPAAAAPVPTGGKP